MKHVEDAAAEGFLGRNPGRPLGCRIPEHDPLVAVDGDDPVRDIAEDRDAALTLQLDLLVELGLREGNRRVRGERAEGLDFLLLPGSRAAGVDREYALQVALGAQQRHREVRGVASRQHRVALEQNLVAAHILDRNRRPRMNDRAGGPRVDRNSRPAGLRRTLADGRRRHELVVLEQPNRSGVGAQERGRLFDDLVQDGARLQLTGEEAARVGELLGEQS